MLTLDQAKELAATRSRDRDRAQFINRYYYHSQRGKQPELRYVVEEDSKNTRTVHTYMHGECVE